MISCKKDSIILDSPIGGNRFSSYGGFTCGLFFGFEPQKDDDYAVEVDASQSNPSLRFHRTRGVFYDYLRIPLGNKGMVKWDKNEKWEEERPINIFIDRKSVKLHKEYSFKINIYKNGKIIDKKNVTFTVALYKDRSSDDMAENGKLEKLCLDNWKNVKDFSKEGFRFVFEYPIKDQYNKPERLKEIKKAYDDCYIEDPDSDKY